VQQRRASQERARPDRLRRLAQRADRLAEVGCGGRKQYEVSDPGAAQQPQHLLFTVASVEFALPAEVVQGVERTLEITPVPNTVPWVAGIVQAWGGIVSAVDLQAFFGLQAQPLTPRSRLVVVTRGDLTVGLLVNSVVEMRSLGDGFASYLDLRATPEWAQ